MISTSHTLAQRIAAGRMAVSEGLQVAMQLAEQLRLLHDTGAAHGALTPSAVAISGNTVELLPPSGGASAYDAPEVRQGAAADARSDIFSFGAIVFEMLTGQPAFAAAGAGPLDSGSAPIDRLVNGCVAASPDSRYQRIQKVILELRLLLSNARRGLIAAPSATVAAPSVPEPIADAPLIAAAEPANASPSPLPAPVPVMAPAAEAPTMQAMHDLEARISARLQDQERTIANVAHVANEVLKALREQQTVPVAAAAPPAPRPVPVAAPAPEPPPMRGFGFRAGEDQPSGSNRMDKMLDLLSDKLSRLDMVVTSAVERLQRLEDIFDQFDTDAAALRDSVTRDIRTFERSLKAQSAAIESARTAMGQTDDLVERVVEAIDALQGMFVNSAEEQTLAS